MWKCCILRLCRWWYEKERWWCWRLVSNIWRRTEPPDQRESNDSREVVTESKDNQIISLGGTMWWKMSGLGRRVEHDCKVGVEVKLIREQWKMESGGRREDDFVKTVVSEATIQCGLEQVVKVSWQQVNSRFTLSLARIW